MTKMQGFILSYIKQNEQDAILKIFTKEQGIQSYYFKNLFHQKSKAKSLLQPLFMVDFHVKENQSNRWKFINNIEATENSKSMKMDLVINAQFSIIAEILKNIDEKDNHHHVHFYETLVRSTQLISEGYNNAFLQLIYFVIKFLGYQFLISDAPFFNLEAGTFTPEKSNATLSLELSNLLRTIDSDEFLLSKIEKNQRVELVNSLLKYLEIHQPNFRKPNSLEIFRDIL